MGRAERVSTPKVILNPIICVPESEGAKYKEFNDCEIVTHPDTVKGLNPKRNWICDTFNDVFMIDDDCARMVRLYDPKDPFIIPIDAGVILNQTYELAKQIGVHLFGFNNVPNPIMFDVFEPIKLTGYLLGGAFGVIGWKESKLWFDTTLVGQDDYWICGLNAYYHRKLVKDGRFAFVFNDTFQNQGGQSNFRTNETEMKDTIYLRKFFGSAINIKKANKKGPTKNVPKTEYARTLTIPF